MGYAWCMTLRPLGRFFFVVVLFSLLQSVVGCGRDGADKGQPQTEEHAATLTSSGSAAGENGEEGHGGTHGSGGRFLPPCEQAMKDILVLAKATKNEQAERQRAAFLQGCQMLPPAMQQCMLMDYAVENQAECAEARRSVDPEVLKKAQALFSGHLDPAETKKGEDAPTNTASE